MIDDVLMLKWAEHTQVGHIRAFRKPAKFQGDRLHIASFCYRLAFYKS